jgi:hypothetical protein
VRIPELSTGDNWRTVFRPDVPSPARMYNYFLGGKDDYPADREAAEQVIAASPGDRVRHQAVHRHRHGPAR